MSTKIQPIFGTYSWYNESGLVRYLRARIQFTEERDETEATYRTTDSISFKVFRLRFGLQFCRYSLAPWYSGKWCEFRELITSRGHQLDFLSVFSVAYRIESK